MPLTEVTNIHNLPPEIVEATRWDNHVSKGDISVTQLISSPQIQILKRQHPYTEDAMEKINTLWGSALHHILERGNVMNASARNILDACMHLSELAANKNGAGDPEMANKIMSASNWIRDLVKSEFPDAFNDNVLIEQTLTVEIDGVVLSGTVDRYDKLTKTVSDYKSAKTWSWIFDETKVSWRKQLNVYAYMLRENGYPVDKGMIYPFFKDWTASGIQRDGRYPQHQVEQMHVKIGSQKTLEKWLRERIQLFKIAWDGGQAICTDEDRWYRDEKFKVMKRGAKRALRVFDDKGTDNEALANQWLKDNEHKYKGDIYVQKFPGENLRCERYCPVKTFCPQYQALLKEYGSISS